MQDAYAAGGIVVGPEGKIVVVTNEIGTTTYPKGGRENGETAEQNARREIQEETGLTELNFVAHIGTIVRPGRTKENIVTPTLTKHIDMFLVTTRQSILNPNVDDIIAAWWLEPHAVADALTHPAEAEFFRDKWPDLKRKL